MLPIQIKDLTRQLDGTPGDHLVVNIGEGTKLIVDTSPEERDVRLVDGENVYKISLDQAGEVLSVLENDLPMTATTRNE